MQHRLSNRPRTIRIAAAAALTALVAALAPSPAAAAEGTFTQILCANPDTGQGLGVRSVDGLTTPASAPSWAATVTPSTCDTSPRTASNAITLGPRSTATVPYGGYAGLHYRVADSHLTLQSARYYRAFASGNHPFEVATRISQHGGGDPSEATAPTNGFDTFWSGQSQAAGHANQPFAYENAVSAAHDGRSFSLTAQCRDTGATCSHGAGEWSHRFFGGKVRLHDDAAPVVQDLSGSLLDGGPVTTEDLTFRVTDAGAGIYRYRLAIGGEEVDVRDLTTGSDLTTADRVSTCFDLNPTNGDPYEFAHQQPCPASLERTVTVRTADIADGTHHLHAVVEDAGGNETVLVDRAVVVDNHPAPELADAALPPISGTPAVGAPLTGSNGTWRDARTYDFYWERCPTETTCSMLADSPGRTYVPSGDDVGARMRFMVIATNEVGEWTVSTSPYSAPVSRSSAAPTSPTPTTTAPATTAQPGEPGASSPAAELPAHGTAAPTSPGPNGRGATRDARLTVTARGGRTKLRTAFRSRTPISGRLTDAAGRPIAGAVLQIAARHSSAGAVTSPLGTTVTGDNGGFSYTIPSGPSRRVEVAYRTNLADERPAVNASLRLVVPASLSLRVRPARPGRTTWMTGRLRHLPRAGVQIQVQALDGRRWRTFDTTMTKRGGRFRYGYRFKPTAAGRTFSLRVLVASPIYPFARGASRAARIRVPA